MNVEDHHKHSEAIRGINRSVSELSDLADAAYVLGNERLAKNLSRIAAAVEGNVKEAEVAYVKAISDRVADAQIHSSVMLATLMNLPIGKEAS